MTQCEREPLKAESSSAELPEERRACRSALDHVMDRETQTAASRLGRLSALGSASDGAPFVLGESAAANSQELPFPAPRAWPSISLLISY